MVLTLRLFTLITLYSFCSASSIEKRSAEKEENDDNRGKDYGLRVFGNVKNSLMKTKADHKATIDGDVVDSNVHNLGSNAKNGYIDNEGGLYVEGNVEKSNMRTNADHKAKVKGNIIDSEVDNVGASEKGGPNDGGLHVEGNVEKSNMRTDADHKAKVSGNIVKSGVENKGPSENGGSNDGGLHVEGNVEESYMKTNADHKAKVGGNVVDSKVENVGPSVEGGSLDGGLHVEGNVERTKMKTHEDHDAKVKGDIIDSEIQNLGKSGSHDGSYNSNDNQSDTHYGRPEGDMDYHGNVYKVISEKVSFSEAQEKCKDWHPSANLASVHSQEEHEKLVKLLEKFHEGDAWIGGTDEGEEGHWRWVDGSKFSWTKWYHGEPNNSKGQEHCLQFVRDAWKAWNPARSIWNDTKCRRQMVAICKF